MYLPTVVLFNDKQFSLSHGLLQGSPGEWDLPVFPDGCCLPRIIFFVTKRCEAISLWGMIMPEKLNVAYRKDSLSWNKAHDSEDRLFHQRSIKSPLWILIESFDAHPLHLQSDIIELLVIYFTVNNKCNLGKPWAQSGTETSHTEWSDISNHHYRICIHAWPSIMCFHKYW